MIDHSRGFTVIELLLALALTSLLTAGISVMVGQAARDRHAMQQDSHAPAWSLALIDVIELDLRQARWWAGSEDRIVLIGLGRDGMPAQIEYRWEESEHATLLSRKENRLTDGQHVHAADARVLAIDLQGLELGSYAFGSVPTRTNKTPPPISASSPHGPSLLINGQLVPLQVLPEQIAIELFLEPGLTPTARREVMMR